MLTIVHNIMQLLIHTFSTLVLKSLIDSKHSIIFLKMLCRYVLMKYFTMKYLRIYCKFCLICSLVCASMVEKSFGLK